MDEHRFDEFAKMISEPTTTRRLAIRSLSRVTGGVVLSLLGLADAEAGKKKKKSDCPKKPCPSGHHRNKRSCKCECTRVSCSGGKEFDTEACACRCPAGLRECRDGCVGPNLCCPGDPPCPEDPKGCCYSPGLEVCTIDGCCAQLDGMKACNNFCVDTNTNPHHCGNCDVACEAGKACVNGVCVPKACPSCFPNETCCNGECKQLNIDPDNCGACGRACDQRTERCREGQCHDRCSLNTTYRNRCDQGGDYWCCPDNSPICCRDSGGDPHCCPR